MKNVLCVHGTIEIALERIQRDIAANLRRQKQPRIRAMCVMSFSKFSHFCHYVPASVDLL